MANLIGNALKKLIGDNDFDWLSDQFDALLVDSSCDVDVDDTFLDDVGTLGELSDVSYDRVTLTGKTVTRDDTNNRTELDCDDVLYPALDSGTAAKLILVRNEGADPLADQRIVAIYDSGFPVVTNGGDVTFVVNAEGMLQIT